MTESNTSFFEPVERDMVLVEESLGAVAGVDFPWFSEFLSYIVKSGGKRVRPVLTLATSKLEGDYDSEEKIIPVATGVELLHTATLVHDDTIDRSDKRRGRPTPAVMWGWGTATLVGDYLFAKAAELVSLADNVRLNRLFARTLMALCAGELEETHSSFDLGQDRELYFKRIANKTASLFAMATESGALVMRYSEEGIDAVQRYGYNLGMAFQIADDVFDFVGEEDELGKPVAGDLIQGHLTLPTIILQEHWSHDSPVPGIFNNTEVDKNTERAIDMIRNSGIVEQCYDVARGYIQEARSALDIFSDNIYHRKLCDLAEYAIERSQ